MSPSEITLTNPCDWHVHLRDQKLLNQVAASTASMFRYALVMPNLTPPIRTPVQVTNYRQRIMSAVGEENKCNFCPLMTFKILPDTCAKNVYELSDAVGRILFAGKIYPKNLTTNAGDGVDDYRHLTPVFEAMEKRRFVLCLHGEQPGLDLDGNQADRAERVFIEKTLPWIARGFPQLRIVLEHITTKEAVQTVLQLPSNVAATITVHHLLLNRDDTAGYQLSPANYCKPVAKSEEDRRWLLDAATWGNSKFFFGSDSAPHSLSSKAKLHDCCAGIFTAPVALPLLAQIFEAENSLDKLQGFVSDHGLAFYHPMPNAYSSLEPKIVKLKQADYVPDFKHDIPLFMSGEKLPWEVSQIIN